MIGLSHLASGIMLKDACAFGADLCSPDGSGNLRIEDPDPAAVGFPQQRSDLSAVVGSAVNHGQQHSVNLQPVIDVLLHTGNSSQQLLYTFDGQILRLNRDDDPVCGCQRVDRQHSKRRTAIQQDMIVILAVIRQNSLQCGFPAHCIDKGYLHAGQ